MTAGVIGNKKLVTAANSLLAGLLAITCIFLIRDFISFRMAGALRATGTSARITYQPGQQETPLMAYSAVTKDNVFGFPPVNLTRITASSAQNRNVPPATVSLIGTVSGAEGYAVVLRNSKEELYRAGQMIPGVGHLKTIGKNSVSIASLQGGPMNVKLKNLASIENATAPPAAAASRGPMGGFVSSTGQNSYVVNKSAVENAINNPSSILADARMLPNMVKGRQQGFVMWEVKPGGLFSDLGLRNGDILLKVNNNEINGPDMALRAFTALRGLDTVDLDVIRGGQKMTFTYQIK